MARRSMLFNYLSAIYNVSPTTPIDLRLPVWAAPRSLAATRGIAFAFFSSGYLDVSVPRVGCVMAMYSPSAGRYTLLGLPHSEISGLRPVSGSPELIAAVHVLLRLPLPRHPPYALYSLTVSLRHVSIFHSLAKSVLRTSRTTSFDDFGFT